MRIRDCSAKIGLLVSEQLSYKSHLFGDEGYVISDYINCCTKVIVLGGTFEEKGIG